MTMLCTAELNMTKTVGPNDIADFLTNAAWAVCFTKHIILKASTGAAIFGAGMLFDINFLTDWNKIKCNAKLIAILLGKTCL